VPSASERRADRKTPQGPPEGNRRHVWPGSFAWVTAVVVTGLIACSLLTPGRGATPGTEATSVAVTPTSESVVAAFDASETSFRALHDAIELDPAGVIAQAQVALSAADPETRFAAVYALGLAVDQDSLAALRPVLDDPEVSLRTIAAGALIGLGEPGSLPVLIEAMDSDEMLPFSDPPLPIWTFADSVLAHYTGIDFGIAAGAEDQHQASAAAWRDWWEQNGGSLTWDGSQWTAPP